MTKPKNDDLIEKKGCDKCIKGNEPCTHGHTDQYAKKHQKGDFPRRIWPTDSEKKKGPKI